MTVAEIKFEEGIKAFGIDEMLRCAQRVVVAYSGGADSQLLLHLLIKYLIGSKVIISAVHVNHMIRGVESDSDEKFCRKFAEKLGIKLYTKRIDIPFLSQESSKGLEEAARDARYSFFEEIAGDDGTLIATAHNADDNLETVIFNLLRGTGLKGMCGIPPIRSGKYIRPLLLCTGQEIRECCREYSIPFVLDKTNSDTNYTRNYIRHKVVPTLYRIMQSPQHSVSRMTSLLRADEDFIVMEAKKIFSSADKGKLSRDIFEGLHEAVMSRTIRMMYESVCEGRLERVHIDDIMKCLREGKCEFSISLPGRAVFRADRRFVEVLPEWKVDHKVDSAQLECLIYPDGGTFEKNGYYIALSLNNNELSNAVSENIYNLSIHKSVNFDKIKGELKIRFRRNGDRFKFGGLSRKVKKLLSDRKLTSEEKNNIPFLCDDNGIVWIPGFPVRDGLEPLDNSRILHIYCFER